MSNDNQSINGSHGLCMYVYACTYVCGLCMCMYVDMCIQVLATPGASSHTVPLLSQAGHHFHGHYSRAGSLHGTFRALQSSSLVTAVGTDLLTTYFLTH